MPRPTWDFSLLTLWSLGPIFLLMIFRIRPKTQHVNILHRV